jgi:hypothetical protein
MTSGLSGVGRRRIDDNPAVGDLDDGRVLLQKDPTAEDVGVEITSKPRFPLCRNVSRARPTT